MKIIWCWMMNKKWPTLLDLLNQIHRLACMNNLHKRCTSRIQVEYGNFVFQFHRPRHWKNDLNIANIQKSQNLKNSNQIRTFWKKSNWNRNETRNDNDLFRTFRNCLVVSNSSDTKEKNKKCCSYEYRKCTGEQNVSTIIRWNRVRHDISSSIIRPSGQSSQQSAILTTI